MLKASMKYMEVIELHLDDFFVDEVARPGKTFYVVVAVAEVFPVKRSPEDYCCVILYKAFSHIDYIISP